MERAGHGTNEGIDVAEHGSINPSGWLTHTFSRAHTFSHGRPGWVAPPRCAITV